MLATNATSERSFSALRRVKSYLRTTMGQQRLNYLMLLHVHKERTDNLDLRSVLNEFFSVIQSTVQVYLQNSNYNLAIATDHTCIYS